jgi:hypothetical protein
MTATVPAKYACPAGIRRTADRAATVVWIQSPRTGLRLELVITPAAEALLAPRTVSRITHANANGRQTVEFTVEELAAFKRAADASTAPSLPSSGDHNEQKQPIRLGSLPPTQRSGIASIEAPVLSNVQARLEATPRLPSEVPQVLPAARPEPECEPIIEPAGEHTIEPADDCPPEITDDGMIVCAAGKRPSKGSAYACYLWVQPTPASPRLELYLGHEAWMLPNYTAQRIIDAANAGKTTVSFTPAELAAFQRAAASVTAPPAPSAYRRPSGEGGQFYVSQNGRMQRRNGGRWR